MTATPTVHVFVAGEVATAANINLFGTAINFLLARPIMQIRQSVAQSLANNTQTALTFDSEDVDSSGMHSTVTNTSRATAVYPGWYRFGGGLPVATGATGRRGFRYIVNGATIVIGGAVMLFPVAAAFTEIPGRTAWVFLNVIDYVEAQGYQDNGGALNTTVAAPDQPTMNCAWESN